MYQNDASYQHVRDRRTTDGDRHANNGYSSTLDSVSYAAALYKSDSASKCSHYSHLLSRLAAGQKLRLGSNKLKLLFIA